MKIETLAAALENVSGASFVGVDTLTVVALTGGKANPHKGRITKAVTGSSVMVFQNKTTSAYADMVARRLAAEGKNPAGFELGPRAWGERLPSSPIVRHEKGGITLYYLEVIFLRSGAVSYSLDGETITKSEIIGLADKVEGEQGGLENKVIIRTFGVDSIIALRVDGREFT